jgi:myo-inositol-1(or 4)-monophosphatase
MTIEGELGAAVERMARAAGAVLKERFGWARTVTRKGPTDIVTDADNAAEETLLEAIAREFPGASVLAEESGLHAGGVAGLRFVVDPLDGTVNYASGIPHFAVSVAVERRGVLMAGVVFDPCRDELFLAVHGGGASCNGQRLGVVEAGLGDAVLATGFPYDVRTRGPEPFAHFEAFVRRSRAVRRFGSAALDLAWTAAGRYHGYWERGVRPWDVASGLLLVREAGGACLDYDGREATIDVGEVVAASTPLAGEMVSVVREVGGRLGRG